jgi:hypothetical protein
VGLDEPNLKFRPPGAKLSPMRSATGVCFQFLLLASPVFASAPPAPDPDIQRIVSEISADRIQRSIYVLASFKTRHTLSDPSPSGDGVGGACSWVRAEFERVAAATGGRLQVATDTFTQTPVAPRIPHPVEITNVVATLPGTLPSSANRVYVVSGHYDSIVRNVLDADSPAPGADDDASGVAAVLEMARVMSSREFPSTIVFMAVAGEEQGLFGSAHWAAKARAGGMDIEAMLDNDIIGNSRAPGGAVDRHTVRLFAQGVPATATPGDALLELIRDGGENDTPPRELARAIRDITSLYMPSMGVRVIYHTDRYLRGGDQMSFLEQGYPAVRFTEPTEDYRHEHEYVRTENGVSYGDIPDNVDFGYVADVARVNAAALAALALAPAPPANVQIETARLENDTTLRWDANSEPNLAGYRVVWRETTSPFWEHSLDFPPGVTRTTMVGLSKDNLLFGVEAFDADGHVSPAVYPRPRRTL